MIDQVIIFSYLGFLLAVGLYTRSRALDIKSYGRVEAKIQNSTLFLLTTIFTNSVGGWNLVGLTDTIVYENLSYFYAVALTIIVDIAAAYFILPKLAEHYGVISLGEIMEKSYGKFGRVVTGISATLVSFGYVAVQISVSSKIFQYIFKVNYAEGVVLSYLIVITYTAIGGLRSVLFTDFVQFIALMLFIPIITLVGVSKLGLEGFIASVPSYKYDISLMWSDVSLLFLSFALMGTHPAFIQRGFISRDYKNTYKAVLIKSVIYLFFLSLIAINGLLAYIYYDPNSVGQVPILNLIDSIIPAGLKGLAIVGIISAVTSTAESELNIAAISVTNDIILPLFNLGNTKLALLFAQVAALLIGVLAIYLALSFDSIINLMFFIAGFWLPFMLVPFVAALYNLVISRFGLLLSSCAGVGAFYYWQFHCTLECKLQSAFVGMSSNLACFVLIWLIESTLKRGKRNGLV